MGPLQGLRIIEIGAIGPGPFCAMLLADMGADVIRIDRRDGRGSFLDLEPRAQVLHRNRRSIAMDLKNPAAVSALLRLCESADGLIEGFRPGVMERLGLGPDVCARANPALVYGRMTGWGQDGPLAAQVGHDINYVALSGVLSMIGKAGEPPTTPLNIVGDMGGGGLLLAFGMLCALLEARQSGAGQVVDAGMVEGSALMASIVYAMRAGGWWQDQRESNLLDGGAPFYGVYETADGQFIAVGALEPHFYSALLQGMGLDEATLPPQMDQASWPAQKKRFAKVFKSRGRAEWEEVFAGTDACVTPVLSVLEAPQHPHNIARNSFSTPGGVLQASPVPRFSRTPPELTRKPPKPGEHTVEVLGESGFSDDEIMALRKAGAVE
ncbi:MAG: CaiB/BaiF CoA-transferase family protein [Xanthomonadales bacterium]|nr:CaiB/BaiF CoA-transferase family protein [Xanthomonadales bacterium]